MATTTFVDKITAIPTAWLNDVDLLTYEIFTGGTDTSSAATIQTTLTITGAVTCSSTLACNDTTASTSGTTGSIQTDGGIGAVKDIVTDATFKPLGDTAASDAAAVGYTAAEGLILTGQGSTNDVTIKNDADADVITIATGATNVDIVGDVTALTVNADGDTAAGDNAAMGYTATEGLILTGQGSTNDITIKNDADADVLVVPTGTTNITTGGNVASDTDSTDDLGTTSVRWANVYTDNLGDSGQSLTINSSDVKIADGVLLIKEQADADTDQAGFGQLWVNTATPNELYFTDDAGTDKNLSAAAVITLDTPQATTSGTAWTFTAPSTGIIAVDVLFNAFSTNGTENIILQIGDSGGIETSGYESYVSRTDADATDARITTGFLLTQAVAAASSKEGIVRLRLVNSTTNAWVSDGHLASYDSIRSHVSGGSKASLTTELTQLVVTTTNTPDTGDGGEINVIWYYS